MHATAMEFGRLVMDRYSDLPRAKVLELGALDADVSLRRLAHETTQYVGLDYKAGPGVDFVVQLGEPWPVENDYFDFVLASSVFEDVSMFRVNFLQMVNKAKAGGYIYLNFAPNGPDDRHQQGDLRLNPDSGVSLMHWAESQGYPVKLVESFTAGREGDESNDFVAIFRKGSSIEDLPTNYVYLEQSSSNVITWQSDELMNPTNSTEDILIMEETHKEIIELGASIERKSAELRAAQAELAAQTELLLAQEALHGELVKRIAESEAAIVDAHARSTASEAQLENLRRQLDEQSAKLASAEEVRLRLEAELRERETATDQTVSELAQLRDRLALAESTLLQRAEEIDQTRVELESLRSDFEAAVDERNKLMSQLSDADAWVFKLAGERKRWEEEAIRAQRKLSQIEAETRSQLVTIGDQLALSQSELTLTRARAADADAKLEERLIEIGQLTHAVDQIGREAESAKSVATKLAAQMEVRIGEIAELTNALRNTEQERAGLRDAIDRMEADSAARSNEIAGLTHALAESGEKLAARHNEIARLTVMLAERGAEAVEAATRTEWLRKMTAASQNMPSWWKLLPAKWRREKEHAYFVRHGLFDARSYLEAYPDVAQDGMDPVRHYLVHGIDEGRRIF